MLKTLYFQRKYKEKYTFPLVIETFFAIFAADLINRCHYDYRA